MTEAKQMVGRYEILRKIGEGGFGIVYQARDTVLDRVVAMKQLRAELSQIPEYLELFKREFHLMTNLSHPNINRLFDTFEEDGRFYIVMDYMPNGSLADKIKEDRPLTLAQTVEILKPIARALDYAHSKNLIHRDVKPSNILFTESDEPVLSDFGLVKTIGTGGTSTTALGLGTPEYMAPEQILGRELTPAVDLYSLGVLAFQMLTGSVPFQGNTPYEILDGHVHTPVPDIETLHSSLPHGITDVFRKALEKRPKDRYTSAKEFVHGLEENLQSMNTSRNFALMKQIDELMGNHEYETATTLLEEMNGASSSKEVQENLEDCRRRKAIIKNKKKLLPGTKMSSKQGNKQYELVQGIILPFGILILGIGLMKGFSFKTIQDPSIIAGFILIIGGFLNLVTKKYLLSTITLLIFSGLNLAVDIHYSFDWEFVIPISLCVAALIISMIGKQPLLSSIAFTLTSLVFTVFWWFEWNLSIPLLLITAFSIFSGFLEIRCQK